MLLLSAKPSIDGTHKNKFIEPETYPVNGWAGSRRKLWVKNEDRRLSSAFAESSEQSRTDLR